MGDFCDGLEIVGVSRRWNDFSRARRTRIVFLFAPSKHFLRCVRIIECLRSKCASEKCRSILFDILSDRFSGFVINPIILESTVNDHEKISKHFLFTDSGLSISLSRKSRTTSMLLWTSMKPLSLSGFLPARARLRFHCDARVKQLTAHDALCNDRWIAGSVYEPSATSWRWTCLSLINVIFENIILPYEEKNREVQKNTWEGYILLILAIQRR